jgi:Mg2+ and Co2+ transporter CorA
VAALQALGRQFGIHPLSICDLFASPEDAREKQEVFAGYVFMTMHALAIPPPTILDLVHSDEQHARVLSSASSSDDSSINAPSQASGTFGTGRTSSSDSMQSSRYLPGSRKEFHASRVVTKPIHHIIFPHLVLSFHQDHQQNDIDSACVKLHSLAGTKMEGLQAIIYGIQESIIQSLRPIVRSADDEVNHLEEFIYNSTVRSQTRCMACLGVHSDQSLSLTFVDYVLVSRSAARMTRARYSSA